MNKSEYPMIIRPLTKEEGGGFLVEFPDLPGCMSDGDTIEEAVKNALEAKSEWLEVCSSLKRPIPKPQNIEHSSGKWVQRVPKTLHSKLSKRAEKEGVSLNTLVISMLAEGIGKSESHLNSSRRN